MTGDKTDKPPQNSTVINVTSNNQQGGVTAHTVNMSPPARKLHDTAAAGFRAELLKLPKGRPVRVDSMMGDVESTELGDEVDLFLREHGYETERRDIGSTSTQRGIAIGVTPDGQPAVRIDYHPTR